MLQDSWRWQAAVFESYLASVPSVSMLAVHTVGHWDNVDTIVCVFRYSPPPFNSDYNLQPTTYNPSQSIVLTSNIPFSIRPFNETKL